MSATLLERLRDAGVEPIADVHLEGVCQDVLCRNIEPNRALARMARSVLEDRAMLAKVREWAEEESRSGDGLSPDMDRGAVDGYTERARCGREVLEILDGCLPRPTRTSTPGSAESCSTPSLARKR